MATPVIKKATSNPDFARRVGIHFTMASRIRNGNRMPSSAVLGRIIQEFGIDGGTLEDFMEAVNQGALSLGAWIDEHLFEGDAEPEQPEEK